MEMKTFAGFAIADPNEEETDILHLAAEWLAISKLDGRTC